MMEKIGILALGFALLLVPAACSKANKGGQSTSRVLARVNGVPITSDEVVQRMGGHDRLLNTPLKDRVLDDLITDELLYQNGVKLGLDRDAKFQGMVRLMELKVIEFKRAELARRVRDTQIAAKVNVTEQEVKEFYDRNAENIGTDLHIGLLHFDTADEANTALSQIRSGKTSFERIGADRFAHVPKGSRQTWDLGFMHWNQIAPDLLDVVYGLQKGQVSDVLDRSPNGSFLIKVMDRKKNPNAGLADMRTAIESRLQAKKTKDAYDRYVQQLRSSASVKKE